MQWRALVRFGRGGMPSQATLDALARAFEYAAAEVRRVDGVTTLDLTVTHSSADEVRAYVASRVGRELNHLLWFGSVEVEVEKLGGKRP